VTVFDSLGLKHPDPCVPPDHALPFMDTLPFFIGLRDYRISHPISCTSAAGRGGPGGCDASFWHDVLLCYGSSSAHLHDSVAASYHHLCNSIVPRDDVRALMASHLIALNKCPGIRLIGIGKTLHRVIGKTICLATGLDAVLVCGSDQ